MTYAWEKARAEVLEKVSALVGGAEVEVRQSPPNIPGDLSVPVFRLAQAQGVEPQELAEGLKAGIDLSGTLFSSVEVAKGFLNFLLDPGRFNSEVLRDFMRLGDLYGGAKEGEGKTIVIDYSSPNIAKPFSVGHLRSTIIGHSLKEIYSFLGYRVVGDNHIGDWGTQFGKLMYAYTTWGSRESVESGGIEELLRLYVRFHEEAEKDSRLNDEARAWFKRLETGETEARRLWEWFREISWREFQRVYELLDVRFDEVLGESFYNDRLSAVVQETFDRGLAEWGVAKGSADDEEPQGQELSPVEEKVALIHLETHGLEAPLIVQKSDGTSLYATRDLATAKYRIERWDPEEILYVVGSEQSLYFRQVFKVLELMGYRAKCVHVGFGLVRLPEGRMSTRKGRVILLEEVLKEATARAEAVLENREMTPEEKRAVARIVGIGSVKYSDLSQSRVKEVVFDWDKMLNMRGDSAPYLQYVHSRIQSIVRKAQDGIDPGKVDGSLLSLAEEAALVKSLAAFPGIVLQAARGYSPHFIAGYLFSLAQTFNAFYKNVPVLRAESPDLLNARLFLCQCCGQVLRRGLDLLGIEVPDRM